MADFITDAVDLPGWEDAVDSPSRYSLDKDSRGSGMLYSPDSTVWAPYTAQNVHRRFGTGGRVFVATDPEGREYVATNRRGFGREHGLHGSAISRVLHGQQEKHKGWSFRFKDAENEDSTST